MWFALAAFLLTLAFILYSSRWDSDEYDEDDQG